MSPSEIAWRIRDKASDLIDRYRFGRGLYPSFEEVAGGADWKKALPGFSVCDMEVGAWRSPAASEDERKWCKDLITQADKILGHKLSYFDLEDHFHGDPIDWNRDHGNNKSAPMKFAPSIDYRAFHETGDCKYVWEPNRHHHLVVLGRAYRATGNAKYAKEIVEQLESWLEQCPFGIGMNWRSPLELGIRLINWVWAADLIKESGELSLGFRRQLLHSIWLHLWEITRKYSRGSSANNHLIGEAAGVFVATSYFTFLKNAHQWRVQSKSVLEREIIAQTYPDGCTKEQAFGYHVFVLQFFLIAGMVARWTGQDFSDNYWSRLEKMIEFIGHLTEGGGSLPMIGDSDDGYVLDLGWYGDKVGGLLAVGAVLFERSDFKSRAERFPEPCFWLLGKEGRAKLEKIKVSVHNVTSKAFPESGYYLLQYTAKQSGGTVSVLFDCGELGFGSIAAHGHADALSFNLRAFGKEIFVDPGTYDYFTFPQWRKYFRSTRAHNTVVIDNEDQSMMLGPFMWGKRAMARCLEWKPTKRGGRVSGEHNGYARLPDPVIHRRILNLDGNRATLTITDEIKAKKKHRVAIYFHLAEGCSVLQKETSQFEISVDGGVVMLELDPHLRAQMLKGSQNPIAGWISRGYHRKSICTTILGEGEFEGNSSFINTIRLYPA